AQLGEDPKALVDFLDELRAIGAIQAEEIDGELRYRSLEFANRLNIMSYEQERALDPVDGPRVMQEVWDLVISDVEASIAEGVFNNPPQCLIRAPVAVDQRGRRELHEMHDRFLMATLAVQDRCAERLAKSGETPIRMTSVQLAFDRLSRELPP